VPTVPASTPPPHTSSFVVAADHPALPGHFPGDPLVPGVLIIDRVIEAAEQWLGTGIHVGQMSYAKFVAPLRPGDRAEVTLSLDASVLSFAVRSNDGLVSRGTLRMTQHPVAP
jgi:3-hydroxyacyl-[acyl-carrier-protein] dehydratase